MMTTFELTRLGESTYQLCQTPAQAIDVYLQDRPDGSPIQKIGHFDSAKIELELTACFRPFLRIKAANENIVIGERTLAVEGMNNFRDMGGYQAADGKRVKWGKLFRSDHLYNLTEKGCIYLQKLGIRTIIDYRSPNEISKYPNKVISGKEKTYYLDPNAHTAELAAQFTSTKDDEDRNLVNKIIEQKQQGKLINRYDIVMEQYRNFVEKPECQVAFSQMLKIVCQADNAPLVQHCRGGKDRTGFGAMLLLGILGVSKSDMLSDYMLTHYNRLERNQQKMVIYRTLTQDQDVLDYLLSLIDTQPEFIEQSINTIERQYGSIEQYAKTVLGITDTEIAILKQLYLE